jgi:hypothetical protein
MAQSKCSKSKSIAYLFSVGRGLLEHGPELVKTATEALGAGAAVATALTGIVPFATLGAPLLEAGIHPWKIAPSPRPCSIFTATRFSRPLTPA